MRHEGTSRLYSLDATPLVFIDDWLDLFRGFWEHRLGALDTEIARGKRERRLDAEDASKAGEHGAEDDEAPGANGA